MRERQEKYLTMQQTVKEKKQSPPQFREILGNQLHLNFHRGQKEVWFAKERFIAMLGGTQSGKTCLGPHWLLREIQDKGPGDYLIVTSTYPLLNLKLLPEFLYVFNDLMHLGSWSKSERTFTFWNKKTNNPKDKRRVMYPGKETRVIIVSATNPESIESATAKAAWLDEAGQTQFGRDAFEAVRRRLSLAQGRILITNKKVPQP